MTNYEHEKIDETAYKNPDRTRENSYKKFEAFRYLMSFARAYICAHVLDVCGDIIAI